MEGTKTNESITNKSDGNICKRKSPNTVRYFWLHLSPCFRLFPADAPASGVQLLSSAPARHMSVCLCARDGSVAAAGRRRTIPTLSDGGGCAASAASVGGGSGARSAAASERCLMTRSHHNKGRWAPRSERRGAGSGQVPCRMY